MLFRSGSGFARAIVGYRDQLGGYVDLQQLSEISNLQDSLFRWFIVEEVELRQLSVNSLGVEQLRRHPYLNFYQANAIVAHRKRYGTLESVPQLSLYDCFTSEELSKIAPYLFFGSK